jgi:UDP-hydrolysing UDP-N-acetyl-D-glucosamine 2-epimerase
MRSRLYVSGTHLSPEFGSTVQAIESDGFDIAERIEILLSSDTPEGVAKSMGLGLIGFGQAFSRDRPDILLVYGDRYEMIAATLAALPFKIPVAHISGGELTQGAIDDLLRHSITKLSHLHFATTEQYAQRIVQLGEEPWRVTVSGEPSLDSLHGTTLLSPSELETRYHLYFEEPFLLVTYHPVTLEPEHAGWQTDQLLGALAEINLPVIFTLPNADTGGHVIRNKLERFIASHTSSRLVDSFGTQAYLSVMSLALAMVGNSSSGIVEAASFHLPVVNIGTRQEGRIRARNVIDVGYGHEEVYKGIQKAIDPQFRASLTGLANPYGNGEASSIILQRLKSVPLGDALVRKKFHDLTS